MPEQLTTPIEIACPGVHRSYEGLRVPMNVGDLAAAATWFNSSGERIPLVVGHPADESRPFGFGTKLGMVGNRLSIVEAEEVDPTFKAIVNSGELNRISAKVRLPGHPKNRSTGFEFRHVGFFGRSRVAMEQLNEAEFARSGLPTMERTQAAAFSQQYDKEFYLMVDDLDETERAKSAVLGSPQVEHLFKTEAQFAARLADLDDREARVVAMEAEFRRRGEVKPLIEKLLTDGKLLPREVPEIEALFAAMPDELEVSFSGSGGEVEQTSARKVLGDFLIGLKPRITYGEVVMGDVLDDDRTASFGGMDVSEESDELDKKVCAHCKKNGMDADNPEHYAKALKAVGGN